VVKDYGVRVGRATGPSVLPAASVTQVSMNVLADNAAEDWAGHDRARLEPGFERLHRTALRLRQPPSGSFLGIAIAVAQPARSRAAAARPEPCLSPTGARESDCGAAR